MYIVVLSPKFGWCCSRSLPWRQRLRCRCYND